MAEDLAGAKEITEALLNAMRPRMLSIASQIHSYTVQTHTYRNRTGRLERSHFAHVIEPGKTRRLVFYERGGKITWTAVSSGQKEWSIIFGARWFYGEILESWGYDVVSQALPLAELLLGNAVPETIRTPQVTRHVFWGKKGAI